MSLRDRLKQDDIINDQAQTRITIMTEDEAYKRYQDYASDALVPLFTFSGWLRHKNIKIVLDYEEYNHAEP